MSYTLFNALIYKSWCLCKKKIVSTLLSILWPNVLLFIVIFTVNSQQKATLPFNSTSIIQNEIIYDPLDKDYFLKNIPNLNIAFTPENKITEKIMNTIKKHYSANVLSFPRESDIQKWFIDNQNISLEQRQFGIIFNIPENSSEPPLNFSYTIRWMKNYVSTDTLFPETERSGEAGELYIREGFLGLKILLDDAFLSDVGSDLVNMQWNLREFPYPSYETHDRSVEISIKSISPFILLICFIALWTTASSLSSEERLSGIIERMKMFGMGDLYVILNYLIHSSLRQLVATFLFTVLLKIPIKGTIFMKNSNFFVIWILLIFICFHSSTHCLAIASFFNNAILFLLVLFFSYLYPSLWVINGFLKSSFSVTAMTFGNLLAPFSLVHVTRIVCEMEFSGSNYASDISLIVVLLSMMIGSILNLLLYVYMLNVKPGPYGTAKPLYFIFPRKCLSLLKISPTPFNVKENEQDLRTGLYENVPENVEVGIKILNLCKKFGRFVSVKNVSLDIYVGQITALLGHNGAGKTTTLSMLSGMLSPSSGAAFYQGYNIFTNLKAFHKELGLCPQHNLLHADLSVIDQLIFFGMLKGLSKKYAEEQAEIIVKEVGLFDKKGVGIQKLSGGMQRKLCIGLAMIGQPKVVILDEPTSGLDPESRREIWNILLKLRGERMMLITTHFMEEADALGDQIAIMHHGEIRCYGTPLFLKKQYGAGYHITISYRNPEKSNSIIQIVTSKVPDATIINENEEWIKFNIPFMKVEEFPGLFESLESSEELEISRIGIDCTTMDDVFLKVQEEAGTLRSTTEKIIHRNTVNDHQMLGICSEAYIQRFFGLVMKNIKVTLKKWFQALIILSIVPVAIAYLAMDPIDKFIVGEKDSSNLPLNLNIYGPTEVLVYGNNNSRMKNAFLSLIQKESSYYVDLSHKSEFKNDTMIREILKVGATDEKKYRKSLIVAADFSGPVPTCLYSSVANHAPIVCLNLFYNTMLLSNHSTSKYSIQTSSHPIIISSLGICGDDGGIGLISAISAWVVTLPLGLFIVCSTFIKRVHEERVSSLKHLILMTNISPISYWTSFYICDIVLYLFSILLILITFLIMDSSAILVADGGIYLLLLIFFLFGCSMIWLTYALTFLFKTSIKVTIVYYTFILILGFVGFGIVNFTPSGYQHYANFMKLHPITAITLAMLNFITTSVSKLKCRSCPPAASKEFDCYELLNNSYFTKELNNSLIFLGADWLLYFLLIILKDYGIFSLSWNRLNSLYVGNIDPSNIRNVESDVAKEKDRVDAARNLTDEEGAPIVIVDGLAKKFSRSMTAVYDVSFACKEGECFGLLGVNGAGKTTTFNILSGIIPPTQGNALVKGHSLNLEKRKCLSYMGYCPQFSALIDELTGEEMLTLFAKLRLVPSQYVDKLVNNWILLLGLDEYANKPCGIYSGGNKRKLSTALAFIGDPHIVLLDEPSSGVDPMTRRNLWDVIKGSSNTKQAIIISSHSMGECEAVCDRLTIMAKGKMQCIGNVQHLKSLYGQGYVIMIKLDIHSKEQCDALKEKMMNAFKSQCILKDEHQVLLHYHIGANTYRIYGLFSIMEKLKKQMKIISDYVITDSSLEQVFLSFAKIQK